MPPTPGRWLADRDRPPRPDRRRCGCPRRSSAPRATARRARARPPGRAPSCPTSRLPGAETASAGAAKRSSNCARQRRRERSWHVDLEEALEAPRLEVAGAREHLLAVADERLRVQHRRVARGCARPRPAVASWWNRCAAAHAQLLALRRARTAGRARPGRAARSMRRIIPLSVTYGLTTSSVSARAVEQLARSRS